MSQIKEKIRRMEEDGRRLSADSERSLREHNALIERNKQNIVQEGESSLAEAKHIFNKILLPVFLEIAELKGVPERDPYKQGFFQNKFASTATVDPKRSGYSIVEFGAIACGHMIWDLYKGENDFGWSELVLGVNELGMAGLSNRLPYVQYELKHNVLISSGLSSFENKVAEFVANGHTARGNSEPQFLSM